jgi:hypothetical protein
VQERCRTRDLPDRLPRLCDGRGQQVGESSLQALDLRTAWTAAQVPPADLQGETGVGLVRVVQPVGVDRSDAQHILERLDEADFINGNRFRKGAVDVENGEVHAVAVG